MDPGAYAALGGSISHTVGAHRACVRVAPRHAATQGRPEATQVFDIGTLRVNLFRRQVFVEGQEVHLTAIEYRLLSVLIQNAGQVVTDNHLLRHVWGAGKTDQSHYVRTYIRSEEHTSELQ